MSPVTALCSWTLGCTTPDHEAIHDHTAILCVSLPVVCVRVEPVEQTDGFEYMCGVEVWREFPG